MSDNKKNWKLIQLRVEKGMTQPDMAKILEMNITTYVRKENGYNSFKLNEMIKIKKLFGLTLDEIFLQNDFI